MPCILVVDDDPETLMSLVMLLGVRYPVLAATSGDEAIGKARSQRPSAIVLDVMMPGGKDGFTVFLELRKDRITRDIPVVFLTGVNQITGLPFDAEEIEKRLGCKPAAFLEKPVPPATLLAVMASIVGQGISPDE